MAYSAINPFDVSTCFTDFGMFSSRRNFKLGISFSASKPCSINQSASNHVLCQTRIFHNKTIRAFSCSYQFKNVTNQNSSAIEGGFSVADFTVGNDILADFDSHDADNEFKYKNLAAMSTKRGITEVDIHLTVPSEEPAGAKTSVVTFEASYADEWGR